MLVAVIGRAIESVGRLLQLGTPSKSRPLRSTSRRSASARVSRARLQGIQIKQPASYADNTPSRKAGGGDRTRVASLEG